MASRFVYEFCRASPAALRGKGTILLGEDETPVERLARLILNRFGYAVIVADCAACALAIWEQESSKIDLLLTDMVMPGGMLKAAFNELTQDISRRERSRDAGWAAACVAAGP